MIEHKGHRAKGRSCGDGKLGRQEGEKPKNSRLKAQRGAFGYLRSTLLEVGGAVVQSMAYSGQRTNYGRQNTDDRGI
jgi:hypothetical protein